MQTITFTNYEIKIKGDISDPMALTKGLVSGAEDLLDVVQIRAKIPDNVLCLSTLNKLFYLISAGEMQVNINKIHYADKIEMHVKLLGILGPNEALTQTFVKALNNLQKTGFESMTYSIDLESHETKVKED